MMPKPIETLDKDMRHFYCANPNCHKLLFRYGAFHHEFPQHKELKMLENNVWEGKKHIRVYAIGEAEYGKAIGLHITHAKCRSCGLDNKYTIIYTPYTKFMGRK